MQWQDFDFDGKVKIPVGFYLGLVYLLRGYVIWVISLSYRDDPALLLSLIYPSQSLFLFTLYTGLPAIITFTFFALKKQRDKSWYKSIWSRQKWLLILTLIVDVIAQVMSFVKHTTDIEMGQTLLLFIGFYMTWYWIKSAKLNRFFNNWLI